MGHPARLTRLPLATRNKPIPAAGGPVGDAIAAVPELGRDPVVDHVAQHVGALAVLDQPERIAAELEVVAPLIDAVRPVAFDIDPALHVGDELFARRRAWLQPDVG